MPPRVNESCITMIRSYAMSYWYSRGTTQPIVTEAALKRQPRSVIYIHPEVKNGKGAVLPLGRRKAKTHGQTPPRRLPLVDSTAYADHTKPEAMGDQRIWAPPWQPWLLASFLAVM
jgi:hypothetical protein